MTYALMASDVRGDIYGARDKLDDYLAGRVKVDDVAAAGVNVPEIPEAVVDGEWGEQPSPEQMEALRQQWGSSPAAVAGQKAVAELQKYKGSKG